MVGLAALAAISQTRKYTVADGLRLMPVFMIDSAPAHARRL